MMSYSASKSGGMKEPQKTFLSQPVRVHEILGVPKSTVKIMEHRRPQPVRIKYLLGSTKECSRRTIDSSVSARCTNEAPVDTRNIRRQLYRDADDTSLLDESRSMTGETQSTAKARSVIDSSGCIDLHPFSRLLKSDGKTMTNDQRSQPVRVKQLLESMENSQTTKSTSSIKLQRSQPVRVKELLESMKKSQTVKPAAQKCTTSGPRMKNVRRKLYCVSPSPVSSQKVSRKALAATKTEGNINTGNHTWRVGNPCVRKFVKSAATQKPSRKSSLLPPNSIRDKHVSLQAGKSIVEESTSKIQNVTTFDKNHMEKQLDVEDVAKIHEIATFPKSESPSDVSDKIPRPSVIMGMTTSTVENNRIQSLSSENSSNSGFALSRPPLQELNRNSSMPLRRIDAVDTSLEDLLGNSGVDRQDSLQNNNLPYNSFLLNSEMSAESLVRMDRRNLSWLEEHLKLSVRMSEENLFLQKRMLRTIQDVLKSSSESVEKLSIPEIVVEYVDGNEKKSATDSLRISLVHEDEVFEETKETSCVKNVGDVEEDDKENVSMSNDRARKEEDTEIVSMPNDRVRKEEDKGNGKITPRRSARIAAIQARSPKSSDDSFSRIETELNIIHAKSKPSTPRKTTPAKWNPLDARNRRSIREYMAIKSCLKFLKTPDQKGLPTPKGDKTGTPAERGAIDRAVSRQLLTQLSDLYDDSPE